MEGSYEETMEALQKANATLEEKSIMFQDKEEELSALSRRIMLLEGEANIADLKLANTTMEVNNFPTKPQTNVSTLQSK